ncbi:GIY-YIG nuclease family protein [Maribacter dokdonensis]|uniref:GIY-YIG nuclease family protein n=1 Tax=Maribacter dokdonensis TaxID=320912 RepID=UPI001C09DDED|nr:GIY-YIG nuclease family protein [Maribacter dokdonensis]MBU2900642.1 GIY-YIG nuclease family protein [Maribacter dokdonensis]
MSSHTYILYSTTLNKFYIGACHKDIDQRIENHNAGVYGSKSFTSNTNDWVLFLKFDCDDYAHAIRLERKIKSMRSSVYIRNLNTYAELRDKIFNETRSS